MNDEIFTAIFGATATQTADAIVIPKSGLPMTAAGSNGGEQVFAAITKNAKGFLSAARFEADPTQNIQIEDGLSGTVNRREGEQLVPYRRVQIVTSFYERDEQLNGGINPDRY